MDEENLLPPRLIKYTDKKSKYGARIGLYQCGCGGEFEAICFNVNSGNTKSCGCLQKMASSISNSTHGLSKTAEYGIWLAMKNRCYRDKDASYNRYGGRGIRVCDRWLESFENFINDMGNRPSKFHSIERKDNDGDYCPDNCFWATPDIQNSNKRNNHYLEYNGIRDTLAGWAKRKGISRVTLGRRINKSKWPIEKALTEPVKRYDRKKTSSSNCDS